MVHPVRDWPCTSFEGFQMDLCLEHLLSCQYLQVMQNAFYIPRCKWLMPNLSLVLFIRACNYRFKDSSMC